ncbi:hypothetical protein QLQ78_gp37 [Gordonia phage Jojo24]|uniref:Uncharacterized protein n=1 Tax=Gordonia phage Jojo24 TaxID=2859476 RepID=A0AAE7VHS2_9CAUD|nr:hypothetical protein QLQ78_gp37 [Gordonia phage Jojo24]QXO13134.1 hypothetical protein SEA_JOJO24_37 [Gordonia phage Jojo24]
MAGIPIEPNANARQIATAMQQTYAANIGVGFTSEQAMRLTETTLAVSFLVACIDTQVDKFRPGGGS